MDVPDGSYEFYYREQPFVLYVDFLHHKKIASCLGVRALPCFRQKKKYNQNESH